MHLLTHRVVLAMCTESCNVGDMNDIAAHWQVEGQSAFFVVEDDLGAVVGSAAVKLGGLPLPTAKPSDDSPLVSTVWKVSTLQSARGGGVARLLMLATEEWAREAGAAEMHLMTASSGAKRFYERIGYTLSGGSKRGTQFSTWRKVLPPRAAELS